jgi:hypothetical protein
LPFLIDAFVFIVLSANQGFDRSIFDSNRFFFAVAIYLLFRFFFVIRFGELISFYKDFYVQIGVAFIEVRYFFVLTHLLGESVL